MRRTKTGFRWAAVESPILPPELLARGSKVCPEDPLNGLCSRQLGEPITDHRSSWVRRVDTGSTVYFIKVYDYPTPRDRRRGLGRNTALAPSRALREARAARWLKAHGFFAPDPVVVAEARRWGILHRALLATTAVPGTPADRWFAAHLEDPTLIHEALAELGRLVCSLHAAGFRHRNLDLRNLIIEPTPNARTTADAAGTLRVHILDAPRFKLRRAGSNDRLATADWDRLGRDLERALGLEARAMLLASRT